jgi:release factor glutamine methyltransferase
MDPTQLVMLPRKNLIEAITSQLLKSQGPDAEDNALQLISDVEPSPEAFPLTLAQATQLVGLVERRQRNEPMEYLLKRAVFMGRAFYVDERSHIPRPKMETLIRAAGHIALDFLKTSGGEGVPTVEVGTGSGALAISLALLVSDLPQLYATDISAETLAVAGQNCQRYGVSKRIQLLQGDLLKPLPERVRLLVANLPFVSRENPPKLAAGVRYEPDISVFGAGKDGWELQQQLLRMAPDHVLPKATLLVTLHVSQEQLARETVRNIFPQARLTFVDIDLGWSKFAKIEIS